MEKKDSTFYTCKFHIIITDSFFTFTHTCYAHIRLLIDRSAFGGKVKV